MVPEEDIVDIFIRYGLFIGAIFQLVCIGAVILMPDEKTDYFKEHQSWSEEDQNCGNSGGGGSSESGSPMNTSPTHSTRTVKVRRDKKKRR